MIRTLRPLCAPALDLPEGRVVAGGWTAALHLRDLLSGGLLGWDDLAGDVAGRLCDPRAPIAGLAMDRPRIMGILNVTPDSFSDGGRFLDHGHAVAHAWAMVADGADMIDIGGESTRPGAAEVPVEDEIARVAPVIAALRADGIAVPISVDTRKARVADAALTAGADIVNDVSALGYDPDMARVVAEAGVPIVLMHAQGTPATMQIAPHYENVVIEVIDALAVAIDRALAAGIARERLIVDPGIGFGKSLTHNLDLLRDLSAFHALGQPVLLGASRKRFVGTVTGAGEAGERLPGSLAVALHGVAHGMQILRVHDTLATSQAVKMAMATSGAAEA